MVGGDRRRAAFLRGVRSRPGHPGDPAPAPILHRDPRRIPDRERDLPADPSLRAVLRGVPWVIPVVLGVLGIWTVLFGRTRYGRYMYAIGGNPEAARRAGPNLAMIRTAAFALCSVTAGVAILLYASLLGGINNKF